MAYALQIDPLNNNLILDHALTYPKLVLNPLRDQSNAFNNFDEDPNYRLQWTDPSHTTLTQNGNTYTITYNGNLANASGWFGVKMKMPINERILTVDYSATQSASEVWMYFSNPTQPDISYSSDHSKNWVDLNAKYLFQSLYTNYYPFPDYRCRCAVYFRFGRLEAGQSLPKKITITFGTTAD